MKLKTIALLACLCLVVSVGYAEATAAPAVSVHGLENWFFNFLDRLLDLFAEFIGKILQDIFGGFGSLFGTSVPAVDAGGRPISTI